MTLKQFISDSHLSEALIRATVRQIGGWETFTNYAEDVANYGAASGFCGFTYYTDTLDFYAKNRDAIKELASGQADDFGLGMVEMIKGFNCLSDASDDEVGQTLYGPKAEHDTQVANALAWYALEEVSRAFADMMETA